MRAFLPIAAILMLGVSNDIAAAPRSLVPEGWHEAESSGAEGRARVFVSPDGSARLRLGHVVARDVGGDIDSLMVRDGETVTYRRGGRSWFVVSGYSGDEIFYRKSNLACRGSRWHTIELRYPREMKTRLDPVVTAIARGMGAYGSDC